MFLIFQTLLILLIFYITYRFVFVYHILNISKPTATIILVVAFLALPSPIQAMILVVGVIYAFIKKVWIFGSDRLLKNKILRSGNTWKH